MTELIMSQSSENKEALKKEWIEKYNEQEKQYIDWDVRGRTFFSFQPAAVNIEYDPGLKRIKIESDTDCFTEPVLYDNKVRTSSEAIRYVCAVTSSPINFLGTLEWHLENLPLRKLLIDILDHKEIRFENFRCQVEDNETWDYMNPTYESEIRGYA